VAQIRYRVSKVLDAGVIPQHEPTMQERLRQPTREGNPQKPKTSNYRRNLNDPSDQYQQL
jgi:hypothetical protein